MKPGRQRREGSESTSRTTKESFKLYLFANFWPNRYDVYLWPGPFSTRLTNIKKESQKSVFKRELTLKSSEARSGRSHVPKSSARTSVPGRASYRSDRWPSSKKIFRVPQIFLSPGPRALDRTCTGGRQASPKQKFAALPWCFEAG